ESLVEIELGPISRAVVGRVFRKVGEAIGVRAQLDAGLVVEKAEEIRRSRQTRRERESIAGPYPTALGIVAGLAKTPEAFAEHVQVAAHGARDARARDHKTQLGQFV